MRMRGAEAQFFAFVLERASAEQDSWVKSKRRSSTNEKKKHFLFSHFFSRALFVPKKMATSFWRAVGGALQAPIGVASTAIAQLTPALRPAPLPCHLPTKAPTFATPSTPEQVDSVLGALAERAPVWAAMSFAERAALLRASIKTAVRVRE